MMRFHFLNNERLDNEIMILVKRFNCVGLSMFINHILFKDVKEFLNIVNYYCVKNMGFRTVKGCKINRKVSIPDVVYHGLKLCHKELNTYSIALIWRSILIDVVECFNTGGREEWEDFKRRVMEIGESDEVEQRDANETFIESIDSVHIPGFQWQNISKVCFFTLGNEFIGYLRC